MTPFSSQRAVNRLRQERMQRNWRQIDVADQIGTSVVTVKRWERGIQQPSAYFRVKLCALFGKSATELGLLPDDQQKTEFTEIETHQMNRLLSFSSSEISPLWYVPYRRNPFFSGRDHLLSSLDTMLKQSHGTPAGAHVYALQGLGGIGKTHLALEYAYRYASTYESIFWLHAETIDTLLTSCVSIAEVLDLPERDAQDQQSMIRAIIRWLNVHVGWLLIFDNVEDLVLIAPFLSLTRQGSVLLTTRQQTVGTFAQPLAVEPMMLEEGMLFLARRARLLPVDAPLAYLSRSQALAAQNIVEAMDGLPLALDQAGVYIDETQCTLEDYVQWFKHQRAMLLERRGLSGLDHPASVATTFALAFEQVKQRSVRAADLLRACVFLAPDTIPEALLRQGAAHLGEQLQAIETHPWVLDECIAVLRTYSLIHREAATHTLRVHRLVQMVLQERMSKEEQALWIKRVLQVLEHTFPAESHAMECWSWCEHVVPHVLKVLTLFEHATDPLLVASLLQKIAMYFHYRGRYEEAQRYHHQALTLREQVLGSHHQALIAPLIGLAEATWYLHNSSAALWYAQHALELLEHTRGPWDFALIKPLNILSQVSRVQQAFEQAERFLLRALAIWVTTLLRPPAVEQDASSVVPVHLGEEQPADRLIQQALSLLDTTAEWCYHDAGGQTLAALGQVYLQQQRSAEAEAILLRLLQHGKQWRGERHPVIALLSTILAEVYQGQDRLEEAKHYYQQALAIREAILGTYHAQTRETQQAYAALLRSMGRQDEASHLDAMTLSVPSAFE